MMRPLLGAIIVLTLAGCVPPGNGVYERAYRPPIHAVVPDSNPLVTPGRYADSHSDLVRLEVLGDGDVWIPRFGCGDLRLRLLRQASEHEVRAAELQHPDVPAYLFRIVEHRAPTIPEAPCATWLRAADHMLIQPLQINTTAEQAPFGNVIEARRLHAGRYDYEALFPSSSETGPLRRLDP